MAPMKRSRPDAHEGEIFQVESASSGLRQDTQRKKARISVSQIASSKSRPSCESSTSSSSDEDEARLDLGESESGPPATQYEMLRDGNWEDFQNQEMDDRQAAKKFLSRRKQIGENHAADNSIVEEIECVNFMCHRRLNVKLGPLINFVVGENGSGKSAVLTAITLCLGGKAASTNRGSSLKSMIKTGEDQAMLIVKLKNQGNDAYQPDIYGDTIIIERHFSRTGPSGYKLKNKSGRLISSKKGDVDDIIEYYQLQVDNPMNVLTQDAAKTFIQNSTPKQKYQFFHEGVQLEALDNDYRLVSDTCDGIQALLDNSRGDVEALEKRAEEAQAKADLIKQHEGLRTRYRNMQRQSAWAQVAEVEKYLAEREARVATAQGQIEEQERVVEEKSREFQEIDIRIEQAKENESRLSEEFLPLQRQEEAAREAHETAKKEVEKHRTQRDSIKANIRTAKAAVDKFKADITAEEQRIQEINGGAEARKTVEIDEAKQAVSDAKQEAARNEEERPRLDQRKVAADEALKRAGAALSTKRGELDNARNRLQELNQNQGNVMAGFDPRMTQLIKAIRNESGFREKPIGPIGLHLKLKKPIWTQTIEATLGNTLNSFVVTNKSDLSLLQVLIKRIGIPMVNVFIGNSHQLNTTGHEPDLQHDTILRVLDIDQESVRNVLIINHGVDQTILIPRREDGHSTMFSGPRPNNVKACLTLHDSRRDYGHRLTWSGKSHNREITGVRLNTQRKPRMKTEIEGQIALQRDTVDHLEREKNQLETEKAQTQREEQRCGQAIIVHKRDRARLKIDVQRAEERVDTLQSELEHSKGDDARLDGLKTLLRGAEQELRIVSESYGNLGLEIEKSNSTSLEKKRALDEGRLSVADHQQKIVKIQGKLRNFGQARKIALEEKNGAIHRIEDLREDKAKAERSREKAVQTVDNYIEQASKVSARVPVDEGETPASLDKKLSSLKKRLDDYQKKQGGTDQEINDAAIEAKQAFDRKKADQKELEELLYTLKQSFMRRVVMYRRFRKYISCRSRITFNYLLSERAFRGKLTIDHKDKMLDVHVEPDITLKSGKGRQTKTLSGGEKSFSSICLLLSLWEAMGAPLRCLDEFDVFMDDVNRDISTNMIISAARRSVGRQFILISPKGLGAGAKAADADDVKIIKLFAPNRDKGQRRLDLMMQGE